MLSRVREPEVMDTTEEAADYDAMDHGAVNDAFCRDLLAAVPTEALARGPVLDLGTGTALIPIALVGMRPSLAIHAVDAAAAMLERAAENVTRAGYGDRITLFRGDAKDGATGPARRYPVVMSNSVVHHVGEPRELFRAAADRLEAGGWLFVRDLARPASEEALAALVTTHAPTVASEPAARAREERQRELFRASLRAALTLDELRVALAGLPLDIETLSLTSDRHFTLVARRATS